MINKNQYVFIEMPRKYNKKRQQNYSKEDLAAAIEDVKGGTVSLNSSAKKYNIPKSTLSELLHMVDQLD